MCVEPVQRNQHLGQIDIRSEIISGNVDSSEM